MARLAAIVALVAALGLAFSSPVSAEPARYPPTGIPAVTFDLPPGWIETEAFSGVTIHTPGQVGQVKLSFAQEVRSASDADLAKVVFEGAGAQPDGRHAPMQVGGFSGTAFYGTMAVADLDFAVAVIVVRLGGGKIAIITVAHHVVASSTSDALWHIVDSIAFVAPTGGADAPPPRLPDGEAGGGVWRVAA